MKKIFTSVLGLAAMISAVSAFAETKTITTKAEWTAFLDAERTAESNDTVYFKPSDGKQINVGNWTQKAEAMRGRIVIIGVENEAGEKPDMHIGWNFSTNEESDHYSVEVHNCKISYRAGATATSGQVFYANKQAAYLDEFIIDDCEIFDIPRTFLRTVPTDADAEGNINYGRIGKLSITNCDIHYMNLTSGNTWSFIVMGSPFDEVTIKNNTFYDMPYSKQIFAMNYINKEFVESADGIVNVENNDFFIATNQANPFFDFGANIGQMSQYNFKNNLFMRPTWEGEYINERPTQDVKDEEGNVIGTQLRQQQIARISFGMVTAENNIIDTTYRESSDYGWTKDVLLDADGEGAWLEDNTTPGILPETAGFSWDNMPFAKEGNFIRDANHAIATAGVDGAAIGNTNMLGKVPVKVTSFNVNVEGMKAASYTITPAKSAYFVDDEVTITINTHNSKYRQFGNFVKWEDGSTENPRQVTLTADNNFTATVEENIAGVLTAFELEEGIPSDFVVKADLYAAEKYQATMVMMVDTVASVEGGAQYLQVLNNNDGFKNRYQYRSNKFGEDEVEDQMAIVSRRTPAYARKNGHMDFLQIDLCTEDATGISFSAFIGTDNYGFTKQNADYSLDGGATWTNFATVDIEKREIDREGTAWTYGGWTEIKGNLPAEAEGKASVLIRIISDPTSEAIVNGAAGELDLDAVDNFEYTGHILFTAATLNSIETLANDSQKSNAAIYDIMGRRVRNTVAGQLYIQSGKKFFVK